MTLPSALPLARKSDPPTSHMAAAKVDQCASQAAVWEALIHPGFDDEIKFRVNMRRVIREEKPWSGSRLRTARRELMDMNPPKVRVCGTTKNSRNRTVQLFERTP